MNDPFQSSPNYINPDYSSPEQRKQQLEYAKYLMSQSNKPVEYGAWTQGIANMLNAGMGGYEMGRAQSGEGRSRQMDIANILRNMNPQQQGQPAQPGGGIPQSGDMNPYAKSISGIESGGDYNSLGPVTKTGDRAYGKYQVMGENIPKWTEELLGRKMTPQEFAASPDAQEKVFQGKFGQYLQQTGSPQDAASMWFTGKPAAQGANLRDQLGTSGADYVNKFTAGLGPQQPTQMASLGNGIPQPQQPPQPPANGPQIAQNIPNPMQPPGGQQQPIGINTGLLGAALNATNLPPAVLNSIVGMTQPQLIDGPGGKYQYDPRTGRSALVMPEFQKGKMKVGDTEFETSSQYDPRTQSWKTTPLLPSGGTQSNTGKGPDLSTIGGLQDVSAEGARKKEVAQEFGKAQVVPIAEAQKEAKTSANALNALNIIEDVAKKHGDTITTGPFGEDILKIKHAVNGITGTTVMGDTSQAELIKKMNAQLASAALPAFTNRGTQFDLKTFMENNPGLNNSIKGTLFLTNILKQVHRQQFELSQLASDPKNVSNWPAIQKNYYDSHPLINPSTNTLLGVTKDTPQQGATQPQQQTPPVTKTIGNKTYFQKGNQWFEQ